MSIIEDDSDTEPDEPTPVASAASSTAAAPKKAEPEDGEEGDDEGDGEDEDESEEEEEDGEETVPAPATAAAAATPEPPKKRRKLKRIEEEEENEEEEEGDSESTTPAPTETAAASSSSASAASAAAAAAATSTKTLVVQKAVLDKITAAADSTADPDLSYERTTAVSMLLTETPDIDQYIGTTKLGQTYLKLASAESSATPFRYQLFKIHLWILEELRRSQKAKPSPPALPLATKGYGTLRKGAYSAKYMRSEDFVKGFEGEVRKKSITAAFLHAYEAESENGKIAYYLQIGETGETASSPNHFHKSFFLHLNGPNPNLLTRFLRVPQVLGLKAKGTKGYNSLYKYIFVSTAGLCDMDAETQDLNQALSKLTTTAPKLIWCAQPAEPVASAIPHLTVSEKLEGRISIVIPRTPQPFKPKPNDDFVTPRVYIPTLAQEKKLLQLQSDKPARINWTAVRKARNLEGDEDALNIPDELQPPIVSCAMYASHLASYQKKQLAAASASNAELATAQEAALAASLEAAKAGSDKGAGALAAAKVIALAAERKEEKANLKKKKKKTQAVAATKKQKKPKAKPSAPPAPPVAAATAPAASAAVAPAVLTTKVTDAAAAAAIQAGPYLSLCFVEKAPVVKTKKRKASGGGSDGAATAAPAPASADPRVYIPIPMSKAAAAAPGEAVAVLLEHHASNPVLLPMTKALRAGMAQRLQFLHTSNAQVQGDALYLLLEDHLAASVKPCFEGLQFDGKDTASLGTAFFRVAQSMRDCDNTKMLRDMLLFAYMCGLDYDKPTADNVNTMVKGSLPFLFRADPTTTLALGQTVPVAAAATMVSSSTETGGAPALSAAAPAAAAAATAPVVVASATATAAAPPPPPPPVAAAAAPVVTTTPKPKTIPQFNLGISAPPPTKPKTPVPTPEVAAPPPPPPPVVLATPLPATAAAAPAEEEEPSWTFEENDEPAPQPQVAAAAPPQPPTARDKMSHILASLGQASATTTTTTTTPAAAPAAMTMSEALKLVCTSTATVSEDTTAVLGPGESGMD